MLAVPSPKIQDQSPVATLPGYRTIVPPAIEPVTPADLLASPESMRRWLAAQPAAAEVGYPASLWQCPIARFLESAGVEDVAVGPEKVRWNVDRSNPYAAPVLDLPDWAAEFVNLVDRYRWRPITAAHATALLHEATRAA